MEKILKKIFKKYFEKKNYLTGLSHFIKIRPSYDNYKNLNDLDYKVYSQNGEDGIIDYLLSCLGIDKPKFVEVGIGDYSECNSRFIYEKTSPNGLVIDCLENLEIKVSNNIKLWKGNLIVIEKKVTSKNILDILKKNFFLNAIDLFSLDIDGVDYWILNEMPDEFCKIAVIEYNSVFGSDFKITVPNLENFNRTNYHHSNLCFGASLKAIVELMIKKKFKFVGTNLTRCNAFFVSEKYSDRISIKIPDPKNLLMHTNSNFRESRDESGKLNFKSGEDRIKEIYECEIFDLNDQKIKKIKNLFDKS